MSKIVDVGLETDSQAMIGVHLVYGYSISKSKSILIHETVLCTRYVTQSSSSGYNICCT